MDIELKAEAREALIELRDSLQTALEAKVTEDEYPDGMPDGSDITTLEMLAAVSGKSLLGAAFLALNTKAAGDDVPEEIVDEANEVISELVSGPKSDHDGLCLMLDIPDEVKKDWVNIGLDKDDLHITVLYFGEADEYNMNPETFFQYARTIAHRTQPFEIALNGIARFSMSPLDAVVVNADAPELEDLRKDAMQEAEILAVDPERTHGYSPHMTLGYLDPKAPLPAQRWEPVTFTVTHMIAAFGEDTKKIALGSESSGVKDVFRGAASVPNGANTSDQVRRSRRARIIARRKRRNAWKDR